MNIFISFVVALAIIVIVQGADLTDEQRKQLLDHHKECAAGNDKLYQELLVIYRKHEYPPDTAEVRSHLLCIAKKLGLISDAGVIRKDVIKALLRKVLTDTSIIDGLVDKCAVATSKDLGKVVLDSIKCYHENTSEHITV